MKIKKVILEALIFSILFWVPINTQAQVGIGIFTADPSAQLDVTSTKKGFLPPRMNGAERDSIVVTSASAGLTIWCTNCGARGEMQVYDGVSWTNICGSAVAVAVPQVTIGLQRWATQNLNVSNYRNGEPIPKVTDNATWASLTTGAYCYYNNDSATYAAVYGKLYNWYAVIDSRGLAPLGYYIPTDEEWATLETTLGANAGTQLKSTSGWNNNGNGTNSSGFTALPAGLRNSSGLFEEINRYAQWWSVTEYDTLNAWFHMLSYTNGTCYKLYFPKAAGFSVRCLRD